MERETCEGAYIQMDSKAELCYYEGRGENHGCIFFPERDDLKVLPHLAVDFQ